MGGKKQVLFVNFICFLLLIFYPLNFLGGLYVLVWYGVGGLITWGFGPSLYILFLSIYISGHV